MLELEYSGRGRSILWLQMPCLPVFPGHQQPWCWLCRIDSSPPSATYMHQWTGSALVQVMACRLFSAQPLPEPILTYYQLDPQEQISVKFKSTHKTFHSRKCIWKCCLWDGCHFVQGDELESPCLSWRGSTLISYSVWKNDWKFYYMFIIRPKIFIR